MLASTTFVDARQKPSSTVQSESVIKHDSFGYSQVTYCTSCYPSAFLVLWFSHYGLNYALGLPHYLERVN